MHYKCILQHMLQFDMNKATSLMEKCFYCAQVNENMCANK